MFVAFLFDSSNLTFILNLVLLGVVLVVIAYALFSMLKKALPQAFHFVFFILFLVVGLFFVKFSVNFIANYDLSSLQLTIPVDGAEIMVTTPLNTISELLKSVAGNDKSSIIYIALNDKDLNELIQSLAMLIVGYLAFFIYILDIILLAKPIGTLIYHLAFKWIFPKEVRKYKYKRRWKSFLIGLTKGTIAAVMFLTPFTSLVNSINKGIQQNRTQVDDGGIIVDQESYDSIMNWVDAYNDSVFAKVAFGLDKDGRSIDMIITDLVTSADYNGSELLFSNQIRTIADTAETLLAMGLLTGDGGSGIQTSTLLSKEFISSAIEVIKNSDFIMNLFPIVVNIAVSYIEEMDFYTKNLQFDDVDWKNELDTINDIYGSLYDAGIITDLADGNQFSVPFGDESAVSIRAAFEALDESKFLSRVIPAVVYSFVTMEDDEGNSSDLSLYLSDKWEDYENIKWGHELTIVYDTLYQLNGLGINFFESDSGSKMTPIQDFKFINGFFSNSLKVKSLESNEEDEETDEIIDKLMNNFNEVIIILTGLDENKKVIENREYETLFDSELLINSIDKLLPQLVDDLFSGDSETTSLIKRDDVESALGKLEGSDDYKKETYSLLKVCKELLFNDEFDLMNNADENILNNEYFQDTLRDISSEIDDSILLRTCVPTIFEELLKGEDFGGDIPLSGADLNFRNISFAEEIPNLLDGYNSIMKIASSLDSDDPGEIIENLNTDDLANALKAVYNSKIINPEKDGKKNENFYKILDLIFDNQDFKDIGIYPNGKPEYDDLFTDDKDWEKEIEAVATVFANLKSDSIIKLLTDSEENFSLSSINSEEIKTLFGSIDNSKLLSGTFGDLMDELVLNSLGIDMDGNISFRNVTSWADEAECFANALDAFQEIGGEDFTNIDLLNSDPGACENLLINFASLQMFTNKEGKYVFGDFIHDLLTSSDDLAEYLKNPTDWTIEDNYSESRTDFEKAFKDLDCSKDEISNIIAVIDALQANGGLDSVMEGNKSINLSDVTTPLGEATSLRMVVFNIVDEMINDKDSPLKLGNIKDYLDTKFFINENDVDLRKEELNRIADIYDSIMDLGDFSSIEWLDIDPENETKPLLINFASLKILKENSFGKLLHDLLTAEGGALENYLKDPSGYSDESDYSLSKYDFEKASWVDEVKNDYPEIDKFVSVIKSIQEIGSGNDKPGTEGLNLIMSGNISEDELDSVTGALCNASSLRMVVYNVIDDMIKGSDSSFNLGEINLSYLNTEYLIDCKQDERETEVGNVVKIFGEIKELGDDLSKINWIDMNTTDTKTLLTDFASLKMLSKGNEYYFDDLVYDLLIKSGSLADYLRDYGSTAKNPTYLTSKSDFEKVFTSTNSETEINNIIEVINKLQTIGATIDKDSTQPGTLGLNRITSGKAKSGELGSVTEALCNASSLKMVVYNVINDTIKGGNSPLTLGSIDLNKANTEYLIDCDDDSRKEEVKRIVSIYGMTETDEGETFDVYNIAIDELLTEIHESHILNTFDSQYSKFKYGDDLTVFEQFIEYMLSQKGLSDYITYGMTGKTAKNLVLNVANNYCDDKNDEWGNDGEIYLLNNIIEKSKSLGGEFSDTELINLSSNDFKELMNAINKSKLTHNAVYYFFETTSNRMGITTFIRDENKSKVNYLLGNLTSDKDANDKIIEQCGKEIGYFADIIDMAKTGKNDTEGNAETFNFETGSIESFIKDNNNKSTTPLFNLLINSSIYQYDVKADIVYGVFNSAGMADYIRGSNEDEKINTVSSLFEKGLTADVEGASIDAILKQKGDIDFSKVSKLTDLDEKGSEAICNIIRNTKPEVNGNRSRAYFSSEIVAGMLTKATVGDNVSINWYDEDYKYLVDDVADQIKDILNAYSLSNKLDKNSNTFVQDCTNFKLSMEQLDADEKTKKPCILDEFKLAVFKEDYNFGDEIETMDFVKIAEVIINAKSFGL